MKKIYMLFQTALFIALASVAYAQSLADLADKEKARRQEVKNDKVISEEEAAKYLTQRPASQPGEQPSAKSDLEKNAPESRTAAKTDKSESDEPADFQGRPESYWRQTMAGARQKIKDLQNEANTITLKIADLQNQFYREDNGFKRESIGRDINKAFYEQDKNKEDLAKAQDALQDLEKEARKSGALPGWVQ
jgi:hypothetical protein